MITSGSLPDRYTAPSHSVRLHRAGGGGGNCSGCFTFQDGCPTNIPLPATAPGRIELVVVVVVASRLRMVARPIYRTQPQRKAVVTDRGGVLVVVGLVDRKWPTAPG